MSQVYIASMIRGDQSRRPARQASLTDEIMEPVAWASRERTVKCNKARVSEW